MKTLFIDKIVNSAINETSVVHYEIWDAMEIVVHSGTETLRHGNDDEVRDTLLAACIAHLESHHDAKNYTVA